MASIAVTSRLSIELTAGAHANELPAVVLTFDPHPARIFGRGEIKCLTLPDERADLLAAMGVDMVITDRFTGHFADTTRTIL